MFSRRFCGLEIGNAVPHRRQRGIPKGRAHTESHSAPTPSERVTGRLAVRLALQAFENRVHLAEPVLRVSVSLYTNPPSAGPEAVRWVEITRTSEPNGRNRNGQGARLDTNFRPQNYGAVAKTLLATTMMAEFSIFQALRLFEAKLEALRPRKVEPVSATPKYISGFPHFVADAGDDRIGRWLDERLDLAPVYGGEIWKDAAPAHLVDIAVFCDSDDTHTASISYFDYVRLERR